MKPTLLILAAGMGSRYGGLKQVDSVGPNGEAIIDYSIYDAIRAGFGRIVFVIRKSIEAPFREKFSGKFENLIDVDYVFQETDTPIPGLDTFPDRAKPWGTSHAVLVAYDVIKEPFAVINADDYYGITAFKSMVDFLRSDCRSDLYSMIGYVLRNTLSEHGTVNRGVCKMDEQNYLSYVEECLKVRWSGKQVFYQATEDQLKELSPESLVSMNMWGFHPSVFEHSRLRFINFVKKHGGNPKKEFFIPLVIQELIDEKQIKVKVIPNNERWYGVTYREDKKMVEDAFSELVSQNKYPAALWV